MRFGLPLMSGANGASVFSMASQGRTDEGGTVIRSDAQQKYADQLGSRIRIGNAASGLRTGGIQALWIIVIVAGAGVPLTEALGGPSWVSPVLGFVVVVAAGMERIFGRTTPAASAQDALRRGLAREQRLYRSGATPYGAADAFDRYAERSERLIAEYDEAMVAYSSGLARRAE